MQAFDILRQRFSQSALELELTILAKAQEMRESALLDETADAPRLLQIAGYLEASVREAGSYASRLA